MSRLIAGAEEGEADMGDVEDPWGGAPAQPPAPPVDRMDQLIQQVALLWDENLRLQNDVADMQQHAMQRGRPSAPAYHPDPDRYSIHDCPDGNPLATDLLETGTLTNPHLPISKAHNDEAT